MNLTPLPPAASYARKSKHFFLLFVHFLQGEKNIYGWIQTQFSNKTPMLHFPLQLLYKMLGGQGTQRNKVRGGLQCEREISGKHQFISLAGGCLLRWGSYGNHFFLLPHIILVLPYVSHVFPVFPAICP